MLFDVLQESQLSVSPGGLAFTADDWSASQAVTVTATDDDVDSGDAYNTTLFIVYESEDPDYANFSREEVRVLILDNDASGVSFSKRLTIDSCP